MDALLGQIIEDAPKAGIRSHYHSGKPLGLTIDPVLVELDLQQVADSHRHDEIRQILISRPPRQVAHVERVPLPLIVGG